MKIALVGIGKIAVDQHIPAIAASESWSLSATVSRSASVAGVEAFATIGDMLATRPDIEAVSICVPPAPRFAIAQAALDAGRHVMLEKPPGATLAECHALAAMARASGVSLHATWHSREADKVVAARTWLANKTIRKVFITWKEDVRRWHPGQDWIFEPGGLGVFDPGINALSILTEIVPDPVRVTAAVLEVPANRQTPIAVTLDLAFKGAGTGTAVFDWRQEGEQTWTIRVETEQGNLTLFDGGARLDVDAADPGDQDDGPLKGEYPRLYAHFAVLVAARRIDMDLRPMTLVADAFTLGERRTIAPFTW